LNYITNHCAKNKNNITRKEQKYIEKLEVRLATLQRGKTLLWKGGITNKFDDIVLTQIQQKFEEYKEVYKKEYMLLEANT
jgi:hypothetical protein